MTTEATQHVRYRIEVVGTKFIERFQDEEEWVRYLRMAWEKIGITVTGMIQEEIGNVPWLNPTGRLQRAVAWKAENYRMMVYMDPAVAPYAVYQEVGVQKHIMRYLLSATRPIPVPTGEKAGSKYPRVVYRWAMEKWMGIPHPYTDQRGEVKMATGWVHPGYEGKRFFRKGVVRGMEEATRHLKLLVFRMIEESNET